MQPTRLLTKVNEVTEQSTDSSLSVLRVSARGASVSSPDPDRLHDRTLIDEIDREDGDDLYDADGSMDVAESGESDDDGEEESDVEGGGEREEGGEVESGEGGGGREREFDDGSGGEESIDEGGDDRLPLPDRRSYIFEVIPSADKAILDVSPTKSQSPLFVPAPNIWSPGQSFCSYRRPSDGARLPCDWSNVIHSSGANSSVCELGP